MMENLCGNNKELCVFRCVASVVATHFFYAKEIKMDYQKLYQKLFRGITETIDQLQELQKQAEDDYLRMGEESNVVKFNLVQRSKAETEIAQSKGYVLSVDDAEYDRLLQELYTEEWKEPVKGLLDETVMKNIDATAVQYIGDKFNDVVLFVSNRSNDGKHIISISPVGEKDKLSIDEHIAILENFENAHKSIKFIKQ